MSFAALMPGTGRVCAFRIPPVPGKIRVSTSNHQPVGGIRSHESTDLTPGFLSVVMAQLLIYQWLVTPTRERGLSEVWCQGLEVAKVTQRPPGICRGDCRAPRHLIPGDEDSDIFIEVFGLFGTSDQT